MQNSFYFLKMCIQTRLEFINTLQIFDDMSNKKSHFKKLETHFIQDRFTLKKKAFIHIKLTVVKMLSKF